LTKAQEVYEKVEELKGGGMSQADAFKKLAEEYGQPLGSIRGAYYSHSRGGTGSGSKPRKRETTPDDAIAEARATLERSIANIDREVVAAEERAKEAKAEFEAMKKSAPERKQTIQAKLEALA
jgi:hypothetical protein